jgi:SAM-dependent methyltransferase
MSTEAAASWDAEYASGRYRHEPPVGFTRDIISAARAANLRRGLYIGCGNGRNLVPLSEAGLDLIGLDISARAIAQLRERPPGTAGLAVGGIDALRPSAEFDLVIGIQVFQHGNRGQAHWHLTGAAAHVAAGGLLCVRVNATGTDIRHRHERTEEDGDGGFTIRYLGGPKTGLEIHFFTAAELTGLMSKDFSPVMPPRLNSTPHVPPARGQWSQWEAIWQRRTWAPDAIFPGARACGGQGFSCSAGPVAAVSGDLR